MRVLVTGGAGFIGSHIVKYYQGKAEVRVLDNLRSGFKLTPHQALCGVARQDFATLECWSARRSPVSARTDLDSQVAQIKFLSF
jgi:nucleoside-diphosphate-sugar epimerase